METKRGVENPQALLWSRALSYAPPAATTYLLIALHSRTLCKGAISWHCQLERTGGRTNSKPDPVAFFILCFNSHKWTRSLSDNFKCVALRHEVIPTISPIQMIPVEIPTSVHSLTLDPHFDLNYDSNTRFPTAPCCSLTQWHWPALLSVRLCPPFQLWEAHLLIS